MIFKRCYLLADDIFSEMVSRNTGEYRYPLGGKLYVFNKNENIGFIKGHMCSPAIATQAEDLIAGDVKELIHVGYAGGLQPELVPGEILPVCIFAARGKSRCGCGVYGMVLYRRVGI